MMVRDPPEKAQPVRVSVCEMDSSGNVSASAEAEVSLADKKKSHGGAALIICNKGRSGGSSSDNRKLIAKEASTTTRKIF